MKRRLQHISPSIHRAILSNPGTWLKCRMLKTSSNYGLQNLRYNLQFIDLPYFAYTAVGPLASELLNIHRIHFSRKYSAATAGSARGENRTLLVRKHSYVH
jgi:hypothetical protein